MSLVSYLSPLPIEMGGLSYLFDVLHHTGGIETPKLPIRTKGTKIAAAVASVSG